MNAKQTPTHHESTTSQTAVLEAIAAAQASLEAAQAELDEADADADADDEADEPAPVTSHVHVILDDATTIDGVAWSALRDTAMAEGYTETDEFNAYSSENRAIISAFIDAQTEAGEGVPLVSSTEVFVSYVDVPVPETPVDTKTHTLMIIPDDDNVVYWNAFDGETWGEYKSTAMAFGWDLDPVIKVLPNFERSVIEAHQQAQIASGDPAGALTGQDAVAITWVDDESPVTRYFNQSFDATLNDETVINGVEWKDFKATAMDSFYEETDDYANIGEVDKFIVDRLIAEQDRLDAYDTPLADTVVSLEFTFV